ncbi:MAG TPA: hypothetical protein VGM08_04710 [Candidatus Saccharimonadales bacterium]
MNYRGIIKYKIGLVVIGLFTVAMLVVVLVQAGATKQDTQTDKVANSMADSLNSYTDVHYNVPTTLREVDITKTSPYISYTRLSASKYKFCVTYKATSSDFDPSDAVGNVLMTGEGLGGGSTFPGDEIGDDAALNTDLYIPTSHHKGLDCQTIDINNGATPGGGSCGNYPATYNLGNGADSTMCPLQSGVGGIGVGPLSSLTPTEADSVRQADIDALQAHLETYIASTGYYPTLAELNSASWRSANMKGLAAWEFCDPSAGSTSDCQFVATPKKDAYSYQPTDVNSNNCTASQSCTGYTLTATLSTGDQYADQSQN